MKKDSGKEDVKPGRFHANRIASNILTNGDGQTSKNAVMNFNAIHSNGWGKPNSANETGEENNGGCQC